MKRPSSGGRKSSRNTDKPSKSTKKTGAGLREGKSRITKSDSAKPARSGPGKYGNDSEKRFSKDSSEGYKKETSKRSYKGSSEGFSKDDSASDSRKGTDKFKTSRPERSTRSKSDRVDSKGTDKFKTDRNERPTRSKTDRSDSKGTDRYKSDRPERSTRSKSDRADSKGTDRYKSDRPERPTRSKSEGSDSKDITERFNKDSYRPRGTTERFSKEGPVRGSKPSTGRYSKDAPSRDSKSRDSKDSDKKYADSGERKFQGDRPAYGKGKPYVKRSGSKAPAPSDPSKGVRLNRYVANSGVCSRREADELILAGIVSVNDQVVLELGTRVMHDDVVRYNGSVIRNEKPVYILLNKPKDYITTTDDPKERKTVMQLIAKSTKARVYPVGRLDRTTTGLLLLTNDGDLTTRLTHPSFQTPKIYAVELDKPLKTADLQKIDDGFELEDGFIKPDEIKYNVDDKKHVGIEIHSGKNRIVRRIFSHLGYTVVKLDRVMFAGLTKKDLPRGKFRNLTDIELSMLKMMTGKKKVRNY